MEKGQTFDPNFSVPSVREGGMVNRSGAIVLFTDVAVQQFGCLHKSKIAELKLLLQNSKPLKSNVADDLVQRELGLLLQDL